MINLPANENEPEKVKNFDLTLDDAEKHLEPYFPALREIINTAWKDWESLPDEQRAKIDARARANCVNSFIIHNTRKYFEERTGVKVAEKRGLFLLDFFDEINLRFKKLNKDKKPSNIKTTQQLNFALQLELPGMPKVVRLTLGYILDITQTKIKDILIVFYKGKNLIWEIPITNSSSNIFQLPLMLKMEQPKEKVKNRTVKIKAKTKLRKAKG